jgi:hypothetical protein
MQKMFQPSSVNQFFPTCMECKEKGLNFFRPYVRARYRYFIITILAAIEVEAVVTFTK